MRATAAFGAVDRHAALRPAGELPQRQARAAALAVPQRDVDRRQGERGDRADGGGMGGEEELAPERLDLPRVAARQARQQMVRQQGQH